MTDEPMSAERAEDRRSELNDLLAKIQCLDISEFKKNRDLIVSSAKAFAEAATPAFRQCVAALRLFGDVYYNLAKSEYLKCHSKLPGGCSSKRLRKKRKTTVLRWYQDYLGVCR